jgi:hypothetical protein
MREKVAGFGIKGEVSEEIPIQVTLSCTTRADPETIAQLLTSPIR